MTLDDAWARELEQAAKQYRLPLPQYTYVIGCDAAFPKPRRISLWRRMLSFWWRLEDAWLVVIGKAKIRDEEDY